MASIRIGPPVTANVRHIRISALFSSHFPIFLMSHDGATAWRPKMSQPPVTIEQVIKNDHLSLEDQDRASEGNTLGNPSETIP
jgi:hypothetical protein